MNTNLSVTGQHIEITPAIRTHIEDRLQTLHRHSDHIQSIHVILKVEKLEQIAEATVTLDGAQLFAEDRQESMYAAIDQLIDKLDRQLLRHKEKLHQKHL
ncbi:MAG: hypothetical protein RIQ52_1878 [Pseudomonadota bacterium]|jgi:putative sigma-54 modulation protein